MKITLRHVAKSAGVSEMAVSAVLHGSGRNVKVSEEKAELIRKIARELRYQPNQLARSLRSQRTRTIGVVFHHLMRLTEDNPYYPQLLNGIMSALFPAGYSLTLCPKLAQDSDHGFIGDGRFDGVLWCRPDFTEESLDVVRNCSTAVVMMHAPPEAVPGVPTFCADNGLAMASVAQHFAELGHSRVGFMISPVDRPTAEGQARASAFLGAAKSLGLRAEVMVWDGDMYALEPYRRSNAPHTAFAVFSDYLAAMLLTACIRFGIRVPGDLSVVGFDSSAFCNTTTPRLTSVYQPVERMAYEATTHLLELVEARHGDAPPPDARSFLYDCRLEIRESTARPPASPKRIDL